VPHDTKQPFSVVLFDLDATLANSRPVYERAFSLTFQEVMGMELGEHERQQFMGLPTIDFLLQYAEGEQLEILARTLAKNVTMLMPQVKLFAGLDEVLLKYHQAGIRMGVVTSQNREECFFTRKALNIDPWIHIWVTVEDVEHPKPDPQPVLTALAGLQAAGNQAIMIGDSIYDLKAGRAAGTRVGAAAWGAGDLDSLVAFQPEFLFHTPQELLSLL
jgi:pyrophosphatase PpaX